MPLVVPAAAELPVMAPPAILIPLVVPPVFVAVRVPTEISRPVLVPVPVVLMSNVPVATLRPRLFIVLAAKLTVAFGVVMLAPLQLRIPAAVVVSIAPGELSNKPLKLPVEAEVWVMAPVEMEIAVLVALAIALSAGIDMVEAAKEVPALADGWTKVVPSTVSWPLVSTVGIAPEALMPVSS
jgi:hypothetical protein